MKLFLKIILCLSANVVISQNQYIDAGFGVNGCALAPYVSRGFSSMMEYNGDFYATTYSNSSTNYIVKFDADGAVDATFGDAGKVNLYDHSDESIGIGSNAATLMSDDQKIMCINGAYPLTASIEYRPLITKLNLSGSLVTEYGTNGRVVSTLPLGLTILGNYQTAAQKRILIGYNDWIFADLEQHLTLLQLNEDGSVDGFFGTNGVLEIPYNYADYFPVKAVMKENSLWFLMRRRLGGAATGGGGFVYKYDLATMQADAGFGANGILTIDNAAYESVEHFLVDDDHNIFVAGSSPLANNIGGLAHDLFVYKYGSDGVPDLSFGTNGIVRRQVVPNSDSTTKCYSMKTLSGKLVIMGTSYNWDAESYDKAFFARLNPDGSFDGTFGDNGVIINYNFTLHNIPFDFVCTENTIVTCGECPNVPVTSQQPCLVKYLTNSQTMAVSDYKIDKVSCSPNPVKDVLNFNTHETVFQADVYEITGRLLCSKIVENNRVDLSELHSGQYILKVYMEKGVAGIKILVD